ncbi:MAG: gamma-glutamylcyclotransferase [Hyphomicrobiales bacterium]|nr:gamma-glutamylcyclotransferase [Hyphomicrobiales bacterium]
MPLYFAYGSNMDVAAMQARCPRSTPLGLGRLARYRFLVMQGGYASIAPDPRRMVHGVLWDLALADVRALDAYENVAGGLYRKIQQPVLRAQGGSARALVYVGHTHAPGAPLPGYMENVIAAGRSAGLPDAYLRELSALAPAATREGKAWVAPDGSEQGAAPAPRPKVRPRFATPFDAKR